MKHYLSIPNTHRFETLVHVVLAGAVVASLMHFANAMLRVSAGADQIAAVPGQSRWFVIELDPESWRLETRSVVASNAPGGSLPACGNTGKQRGAARSVRPKAAAPARTIQHGYTVSWMLRWLHAAPGIESTSDGGVALR